GQGWRKWLWTPGRACPRGAGLFAERRKRLGLSEQPLLAVLSGAGSLDPAHPALAAGALVLTTERGAERLDGRLSTSEVVALPGETTGDGRAAVSDLHARGLRRVPPGAGPAVFRSAPARGLPAGG